MNTPITVTVCWTHKRMLVEKAWKGIRRFKFLTSAIKEGLIGYANSECDKCNRLQYTE